MLSQHIKHYSSQLKMEEKNMPNQESFTLNLAVPRDGDDPLQLTIEFVLEDGNIASITGTGGGRTYSGTLSLTENAEGGDSCIECNPRCHVVLCE